MTGTAGDDFFDAPITQNPWAGGVSNSLSTADRIDGGAGEDTLHAELVPEFFGVTGDNQMEIQPRIANVENIEFEAQDTGDADIVTVDAKNMTDVVKIGSSYSDGDLVIENLTTKTSSGGVRNTDSITITMDHTDNTNSDSDASDLKVLFDDNYLLSGEVSEFTLELRIVNAFQLAENDDPLVGFLAVTFKADGEDVTVDISSAETYADVVSLINAEADSLGIDVTASALPQRTAVFTDDIGSYNQGDFAGNYLPVLLTSNTLALTAGPIELDSNVEDFDGLNTWTNPTADEDELPIAINVELHKVGRGYQGGDLIIGAKSDHQGIPVMNVDVLGDEDKPSDLGVLGTTGDDLEEVYISTHADYVDGETFASLEISNGFNQDELDLVDADDFLGDLTLANVESLFTLKASGGGDVNFNGDVEEGGSYSYTTGAGKDTFTINLDGDAVDAIGESFTLSTGAGNDTVTMTSIEGVSQNTMQILDNLTINTGNGADKVTINGYQRYNIDTGNDSDFVYIRSIGTADAATGTWDFGATTGPQPFDERVLYKAELTVSFAGFESTVEVATTRSGNFIADQVTINNAIKAAIAASPELKLLLKATSGTADQSLRITSLVDGANELAIDLFQPELVAADAAAGQVVLASADESNLLAGIVATDAAEDSDTDPLTYVNTIDGSLDSTGAVANADQYDYDFQVEDAGGSADATGAANVNFSVINVGNGSNDLVVFDSNDASANILEITSTFGKVSVVNFFNDAARTTVGNHALDFTTFLTSKSSSSGSALSEDVIGVTLDTADATDVAANEVAMDVFTADAGDDETFADLDASVVETLFNEDGTYDGFGGDSSYGNLDAADFTVLTNYDDDPAGGAALVDGAAEGIVMIENSANEGEYKVFNISWYGGTDDDDADHDVEATLLGTLDFGASINFGLVGRDEWTEIYNALIDVADGAAGDGYSIDLAEELEAVGLIDEISYTLEDTLANILAENAGGSAILANADTITASDVDGGTAFALETVVADTAGTVINFTGAAAEVELTQAQLVQIEADADVTDITDADILTVTGVTVAAGDFAEADAIDYLDANDIIEFDGAAATLVAAHYTDVFETAGVNATATDTITVTMANTDDVDATAAIDVFDVSGLTDGQNVTVDGFDMGDQVDTGIATLVEADPLANNGAFEYVVTNDGDDTTITYELLADSSETATVTLIGVALDNTDVSVVNGVITYDIAV